MPKGRSQPSPVPNKKHPAEGNLSWAKHGAIQRTCCSRPLSPCPLSLQGLFVTVDAEQLLAPAVSLFIPAGPIPCIFWVQTLCREL